MADCSNWQLFSEASSSWDSWVECEEPPFVVSPLPDLVNDDGDTGTIETAQAFNPGTGTNLVYTATGLPSGATIDIGTGVITYDLDTPGNNSVTVTLTSEYGSASDTFSWTVTAVPVTVSSWATESDGVWNTETDDNWILETQP